MGTETLEAAFNSTRSVLAGVKAADLGRDTPCASWKVADLINHMVSVPFYFAHVITGDEQAGESDGEASPAFSTGDFHASFDEAAAACVAAFQSDGAMDRMIELAFGTMPGSAVAGLAATDTFTHGWDLAKATGQSTDLDPHLAAELLEASKSAISDAVRGPDPQAPFGPETQAAAGASTADQLAAFLGRTV